jgi:type VI protein secretion system component VasF
MAEAIARGFEKANKIRLHMVRVLGSRLDARSAAAKQRWMAAHGHTLQPAPRRTSVIWLVIGLVILAAILYYALHNINFTQLIHFHWR